MQSKIVSILICCVAFFTNGCVNANTLNIEGYRDVIICNDNFIAVGTGGRIDLIDESGNITHLESNSENVLNSVSFCNDKIIAVGENGTILISNDRIVFNPSQSGTKENINSITGFNNLFIAAADKGILLIGKEPDQWDVVQLQVKGNIVSLSTGSQGCFGVTDKGEIISSTDAINWKIFDYNLEYKGFAKPCIFKKILVTDNWISIAAHHEDKTPVALFSSKGNVWTERSLNYDDDRGVVQFFTGIPNDIVYNIFEDEFILVCDNGQLSVLPSCTKCNKAITFTDKNLWAATYSENTMIIVGDDFYINTVKINSNY
jgi:hypothetical protein